MEIGAEPHEGLRRGLEGALPVEGGIVEIGAEPHEGLRQTFRVNPSHRTSEGKSAPNLKRDCDRAFHVGRLCRLATACPYGVLYAASLSRRPLFALYLSQSHDAETRLNLEITLYGPGWRHYAWVLASLTRAAQHHGSRDLPGLKMAALRRIHPDRSATSLWGADLSALPADLTPDLLGLAPEPFVTPRPMAIDLLSPTHLLSRGKPLPRDEPVPFEVLIKSTLDRFTGLYGGSASPALAHEIRAPIETAAAGVPLLEQDLRGAEASHYSRRSRARLDLGGVVGRLVYGPQAAAFIHILQAAEILHLGKNPTFGCGRLRVDLLS